MIVGGEPEADTNRVVPRPASALPQPGQAALAGGEIRTESEARVSGLASTARRTGRRCRWLIRTAQRWAVDTDGDTVMLQAIE